MRKRGKVKTVEILSARSGKREQARHENKTKKLRI